MTDEQRKAQIAALLNERRGYEMYGNEQGVKDVDESLADIGYEAKPPAKRATRVGAAKKHTNL